jgi:hypothetical protein
MEEAMERWPEAKMPETHQFEWGIQNKFVYKFEALARRLGLGMSLTGNTDGAEKEWAFTGDKATLLKALNEFSKPTKNNAQFIHAI